MFCYVLRKVPTCVGNCCFINEIKMFDVHGSKYVDKTLFPFSSKLSLKIVRNRVNCFNNGTFGSHGHPPWMTAQHFRTNRNFRPTRNRTRPTGRNKRATSTAKIWIMTFYSGICCFNAMLRWLRPRLRWDKMTVIFQTFETFTWKLTLQVYFHSYKL